MIKEKLELITNEVRSNDNLELTEDENRKRSANEQNEQQTKKATRGCRLIKEKTKGERGRCPGSTPGVTDVTANQVQPDGHCTMLRG